MKKENGNSLLAVALLFTLTFGVGSSPILVYGDSLPKNYSLTPDGRLGAGNSIDVFLPLIVKCGVCENIIGNWIINTDTGETHSATYYSNSTFKMIFQGETEEYFGNYSCQCGQFEGIISTETDSLETKGTVSGNSMNGTWGIRKNGILTKTGHFTGQKL